MPHAIFFSGGLAIHCSYNTAQLGGPASHGCVRLHPSAAAVLFGIVSRKGMHNTTIVVR
jgi:lipoprotein-anchoring transpeptidase ErfK/SrfK